MYQKKTAIMRFVLCKEQQHSKKQDFFDGYGVADAPLVFQAGWSDCMHFSLLFFVSLLIWNF
jgi:hypothetical protein